MRLNDIFEDSSTIRDDIKKNRGKKLKQLIRAKAARRNPRPNNDPGPEGGEDPNQFDNTISTNDVDMDWA